MAFEANPQKNSAGQGNTGHAHAGQGNTAPGKSAQGNSGQGNSGMSNSGQGNTGQNTKGQGDARTGSAKPGTREDPNLPLASETGVPGRPDADRNDDRRKTYGPGGAKPEASQSQPRKMSEVTGDAGDETDASESDTTPR